MKYDIRGITDLQIDPKDEEVKICLTCPKKECHPGTCRRMKELKERIRKDEKR